MAQKNFTSEKEEFFIKKADIRTMRKDITRLQKEAGGTGLVSPQKAVELRLEKERIKKEEEEKKLRMEEETREKEEEKIKIEEEEEKKRIEEEGKEAEEEERRKLEEEQRRKEEERRRVFIKSEERRRELIERLKEKKKKVEKPLSPPPLLPSETIRVIPKKPTFREKLWIRILFVTIVIVILAGTGTFWYWFFRIRKQPPLPACTTDAECSAGQICGPEGYCIAVVSPSKKCTADTDCPSGQICGSGGVCAVVEPGPVVSPSLFSIDGTRTLTITSSEELRTLLVQSLKEWYNDNQFTRLVIKDTKENKILGLKEFFEKLLIRVSEDFYQKIDNDFTLFIYSQSQGNRLGFVTRIKNYEGLASLLRNQESTMENNFQPFFSLMGKEGAAIFPYFRNAENVQGYTGPNFRYQTLAREDLGILYLTSGEYFVFTGSWKSMERIIEKLEIIGVRIELTAELKFGDRGYEVELLQTWLAQDPTVYPERIINANFGPKTQQAVIRFQEKYASEILAPQGFSRGTGIVDSYTRIKLNELYAESGIKPKVTELTTDLRFGDHGQEVELLQTWLAKDKEVYPEKITSGYFGYLTQKAIIRFQEKYTSEILTPQGLTRGTGIVDALTRKKLNELYAP